MRKRIGSQQKLDLQRSRHTGKNYQMEGYYIGFKKMMDIIYFYYVPTTA